MQKNVKKNTKRSLTASAGGEESQPTTSSDLSEKSHFWSKKRFGLKTPVFILILLGIIIVLGLLGFLFKDKFLVAIINGKPVFRYELTQRLTSTYGKETLENLIVERLIKEEAARKNIVVNEDDIGKEIQKLEESLGAGTKLEDVLKYQGVSLAEFKNQLKLRLQVNRILEKEITVSQEEVDKYLKDNEKTMIATGEAERKVEATEKIREQKINEKVQSWVSELLSKAKITRFLK